MGGTSTRANIMSGKGIRPEVEARAEVGVEADTDTRPNAQERKGTGREVKRDITAVTTGTGTGTNTDGILIMKNTGETHETQALMITHA